MAKQSTNTILMIEPVAFGFNEQTADNNYFQQKDDSQENIIQQNALKEFNGMVNLLKEKGINVIAIKDTLDPHTPDSIFPNNWISFHDDGRIAVYPMYAENRRKERRADILIDLEKRGLLIQDIVDYTESEKEGNYLEGTGSMILDRVNKVAYAALSERTEKNLFLRFCKDFGFTPVYFHANQTIDNKRLPIYHTNVMMCIGDKYAVVCLDTIDDEKERKEVINSFKKTNKEIVEISEAQMYQFSGNMLQVENAEGKCFLVMSRSAYNSLSEQQIKTLTGYNEIIAVDIPTIEKYGGGSARCMMAEVFLPKK